MSFKRVMESVCPRITIQLSLDAAVADIGTSLLGSLKSSGQNLNNGQIQSLLNGIGIFLVNCANGVLMQGRVNIIYLMLALRLLPKVRRINKRSTVNLAYTFNTTGGLVPYDFTKVSDLAEFFRANGQAGGVIMEFSEACSQEEVVFDGMKFDFSSGYAPTGARTRNGGFYETSFYKSDRPLGTSWIDLLNWGNGVSRLQESAFLESASWIVDFPAYVSPAGFKLQAMSSPGRVILNYAAVSPRLIFNTSFKFPAYVPEVIADALYQDAKSRNTYIALAPTMKPFPFQPTVPAQFIAMAHLALTKVGVNCGNMQYYSLLDYGDQFVLPQSVVEACLGRASMKDGVAYLPYVYTAGSQFQTTAQSIDKVYGQTFYPSPYNDAQITCDTFSYAAMFSSPIYNLTIGSKYTVNPGSDDWGMAYFGSTSIVIAGLDYFSGTIGSGNLANPLQDRRVGAWNPSTTNKEYTFTTAANATNPTLTIKAAGNVNSYTTVLRNTEVLKFVAKMPLPFEGIRVIEGLSDSYYRSGAKAVTRVSNADTTPGASLAAISVSEQSAKNTSFQTAMEKLSEDGAGVDTFLGSAIRWGARGLRLAGEASGFGLVGKGIEVVANKFVDLTLQESDTGHKVNGGGGRRRARGGRRAAGVSVRKNLNNGRAPAAAVQRPMGGRRKTAPKGRAAK